LPKSGAEIRAPILLYVSWKRLACQHGEDCSLDAVGTRWGMGMVYGVEPFAVRRMQR